jgi:L-asparaginase / beta-aspartyl-peptidase
VRHRLAACALLCGALAARAVSADTVTPEPVPPSPASCTPKAYAPAGTRGPRAGVRGPALMLAGAGLSNVPPGTLAWIRAHVRGPQTARAGNVVVLKASGDERYYSDGFYRDGRFAWVQEILIPPCATRADVDAMAPYVDDADVVLFAGGDQANYAAWKGSALIRAVRRVYARGGIVGGGSAGLAIQGEVVYDSVAADRLHPNDDAYAVTTENATRDPLEPEISFTSGFLGWPPLRGTITDTHFVVRDRLGRLVAFLARIAHDRVARGPVYGLGVDEGSTVLVEADGTATVHNRKTKRGFSRGAYLTRLVRSAPLTAGEPLRATFAVAHIAREGERFDLAHHRTSEPWRTIAIDGSKTPPYGADPYR